MSGPRPVHVVRNGAIYGVRFRIPADLTAKLGMGEFHRSLRTADPRLARQRAAGVTKWWAETVQKLRDMPAPTRADLEIAANAYFQGQLALEDGQRELDDERYDGIIAETVEGCRERIKGLERQFSQNRYDDSVERLADRIARSTGASLKDLDEATQLYALQLAAKADMEVFRFIVHVHTHPGVPFNVTRILGTLPAGSMNPTVAGATQAAISPAIPADRGPTLKEAVESYLARKRLEGIGTSQMEEITRALDWLKEEIGSGVLLGDITPVMMRKFRDGIERLDVRFRGRTEAFRNRQTRDEAYQINPKTAARYWSMIVGFSWWCAGELVSGHNPTTGIKVRRVRGIPTRTPPPFDRAELERLFRTPLYAGHRTATTVMSPGKVISKGSYWWSGLIALFTGMRAGEIAQLQIADFDFAASIPVIHVRAEGDEGVTPKKLKSSAATRDIPISSVLLELGLEDFVKARAKGIGKPRVFPDLSFGKGDRRSDALTKFWSRLLHAYGLHAPGRATHVFRHTAAAAMRRAEVPEHVIGGVLGHAPATQTAAYGGAFPINLMQEAIAKIDYGFDVAAMLNANENALRAPSKSAGVDDAAANQSPEAPEIPCP